MRPFVVVSLLAAAVGFGGLVACAADAKKTEAAAERNSFSNIVTEVGVTPDDAEHVARRTARKEVLDFLRGQQPPLEWRRPTDELDRYVVKDSVQTEKITQEERIPFELGYRYRTTLKVEVKPRDYREILEADYHHELEERHWLVGKILAGLVVLLGTVSLYFRLDEWTKGYYTNWLRIGAATLLASVLGGLLLLP
jgi:hypothetical protein